MIRDDVQMWIVASPISPPLGEVVSSLDVYPLSINGEKQFYASFLLRSLDKTFPRLCYNE
jgi:hypothetical protein